MYNIIWDIKFKTNGITYSLQTVASIDIDCSVDNLADTATITLPEAVMNQVLNIGVYRFWCQVIADKSPVLLLIRLVGSLINKLIMIGPHHIAIKMLQQ